MMIGTSAYPSADADLLREAGIGWLRSGFGYPCEDKPGGAPTERHHQAKERAQSLRDKGFRVMGVTPGVGIATQQKQPDGSLKLKWRGRLPEWAGELGSEQFLRAYEETCAWLADDLRGIVDAWQIGNELDWWQFRGPQNLMQACDMILAGARGLKGADGSLFVGTNTGGTERGYYMYGRLPALGEGLIDYCGVDHYYGTWNRGAPENWGPEIEELHAITGLPVLVNEWGFSSAGAGITPEERAAGKSVCELKKWHFSWGPGHTPEGQRAFVETAFDALCEQRHAICGQFFFRWEDQEKCWQCGEPDCPAETAWGLVDLEGKPKPAYGAFRDGVRKLLGN